MLGLVRQDLDDFSDILEGVHASCFLMRDNPDPEMVDALRTDEVNALGGVWLVNERTASNQQNLPQFTMRDGPPTQ